MAWIKIEGYLVERVDRKESRLARLSLWFVKDFSSRISIDLMLILREYFLSTVRIDSDLRILKANWTMLLVIPSFTLMDGISRSKTNRSYTVIAERVLSAYPFFFWISL